MRNDCLHASAQPTGTVVLSIDGSAVAATISGSWNALSATYSSTTLAAGSHTVSVSYTNIDGNIAGSSGNLAGNQVVQYGFVGLLSPYAAPPTAYKIKSAIPLKWQYTDVNGNVVASSNANPVIQIFAMPGCSSTSDTAILVDDAGSSGYQYDSTTNTWQFNWKTSPSTVASGCYGITITSNQSGQTNGAFPIQLRN
ncbi:MAG TPA: PxKF domain-containing protein [Terriglobia bacterium]|nr:PxKF domain-containing protein [Terriglobia bacterium]